MTKVTCVGLVQGQPAYSREVPTEELYPNMTTEGVRIVIPLEAYKRLVNWASVRRTLTGVLENNNDSNQGDFLEELEVIAKALADCHEAVRRHWGSLK